MAELGLDMSLAFPKLLTDDAVRAADVVVTMGCGDACPFYPGKRYEDWELADPARAGSIEEVRAIREEIRGRVEGLLDDLGVVRPESLEGDLRAQLHRALGRQAEVLDRAGRVARHGREELLAPDVHPRAPVGLDGDVREEVGRVRDVRVALEPLGAGQAKGLGNGRAVLEADAGGDVGDAVGGVAEGIDADPIARRTRGARSPIRR